MSEELLEGAGIRPASPRRRRATLPRAGAAWNLDEVSGALGDLGAFLPQHASLGLATCILMLGLMRVSWRRRRRRPSRSACRSPTPSGAAG